MACLWLSRDSLWNFHGSRGIVRRMVETNSNGAYVMNEGTQGSGRRTEKGACELTLGLLAHVTDASRVSAGCGKT